MATTTSGTNATSSDHGSCLAPNRNSARGHSAMTATSVAQVQNSVLTSASRIRSTILMAGWYPAWNRKSSGRGKEVLNRLAFTNVQKSLYNWSASPRSATLPSPACRESQACRLSPAVSSLAVASLGLRPRPLRTPSACLCLASLIPSKARPKGRSGVPRPLPATKPTRRLEGYALIRISKPLNWHFLSFTGGCDMLIRISKGLNVH
jgi:hypothetical protein